MGALEKRFNISSARMVANFHNFILPERTGLGLVWAPPWNILEIYSN